MVTVRSRVKIRDRVEVEVRVRDVVLGLTLRKIIRVRVN